METEGKSHLPGHCRECWKNGLLQRSVFLRNVIVNFSISLFVGQVKSSDPYKRVLKRHSLGMG